MQLDYSQVSWAVHGCWWVVIYFDMSLLNQWHQSDACCIFLPEFGCCAPQTLVKIFIFYVFNGKKLKKGKKEKFAAKFSKKIVFLSLHQKAGRGFYPRKNSFFQVFRGKTGQRWSEHGLISYHTTPNGNYQLF